MDVNGLRFWMLSERSDWLAPAGSDTLYYCTKKKRLQLRSVRNARPPAEDFATAKNLVETSPMARDQFGNYARWDPSGGYVVAGGSGPGEVPIPQALEQVTDLAMGYDGILYVAAAGKLVMIDRRDRWPSFTLSDPDFQFWRLAPLPGRGVLALDRAKPQLGKVTGQPLQQLPGEEPDPGILRSCQENPDPPRIAARYELPSSEAFVALAPMDQGRFALLSWSAFAGTNDQAYLRIFDQTGDQSTGGAGAALTLKETRFPYSLAWLDAQRVAVLATGINEALIYDLQDARNTLVPAGDTYILTERNVGPFAHSFGGPPYYARGKELAPLLPLSLNAFAGLGATDAQQPAVFDSGGAQTVWHRLFIEAAVPPRCGVLVLLAAAERPADLTGGNATWYPHVLGAADLSSLGQVPPDIPRAVWQPVDSEAAFAKPLLGEAPLKDRRGLFMVLVQRAGKAVRSLRGRYLGIRVQLNGDRRTTPEVAALRVYAPRFSYVQNYLPELYREHKFGPDADHSGGSTRRDFFERFVNLFEAQMTRIEDRIANAYLLMRPESSPDDSIDWLGGWLGLDPKGYPPDRRRARLLAAPALHRQRGTVGGITQALDIATNGMASRGAVIVVEDFRLRHIFATILGANLAISNDPLLPGYSASSNSFVGGTLFLGDPDNLEFLALFSSDMLTAPERRDVEQFFERLAHRLTVFVHDQVETVDLNLVQRIVEREKPAHVLATIRRATQPFMVGMASLVGANTYLAPEPPRGTARVDLSRIGRYDVITHVPSLDPRFENSQADTGFALPVARLTAPKAVVDGDPIPLDGSKSTAPPGGSLEHHRWRVQQ